MQGTITLLPEPYGKQVRSIWNSLDDHFGLKGVQVSPFPHFSWQIGESYEVASILPLLSDFVKTINPFEVSVKGVDLFTEEMPVLYLKVIPTAELCALHQKIWSLLLPYTLQPNLYYQPSTWQPHITLARGDFSVEMIPGVSDWVKRLDVNWNFICDNFTLVGRLADESACIGAGFVCEKGMVFNQGCEG